MSKDAISRKALIERINQAEENFKSDYIESISSGGDPFVDGVLSGVFNIRQMVAQAPSIAESEERGMSDSFEFNLHSPLTQEDWNKILDAEYENTTSITLRTPQGRRVRYVKFEVLDKIRAEIMDFEEELFHRPNTDYSDYAAVRHCVEIIDKYKVESEEK